MKRKIVLWLSMIMLLFVSVPTYADEFDGMRLVDDADKLSDSVEAELSSQLDSIASTYGLEAVVLILEDYETYDSSISASSAEQFAKAYYADCGFGYDDEKSGILLLISMAERDWHMYIQGEAQVAVNNYGFDCISSRLVEEMKNDNYEYAIERYVSDIEKFYGAYSEGEPYGDDNLYENYTQTSSSGMGGLAYVIAIAISLVVAFIVVHSMKSGMNTAKPQPAAREYVKKGSFVLTNQQDLFLYSQTTKTAKPKETSSSSGGSSSGSRGGSGGGGKF